MSTNTSSKQRKIYAAILSLALGGLGVDRILLDGGATGPSETIANDDVALPKQAASKAMIAASVPQTADRSQTLAGRLNRIADAQLLDPSAVDDAFRPAPGWLPRDKAKAKPAAAEQVDQAQVFSTTHKLLALVNNDQGGAAIINNQTVVLGKSVDGFKLVEVTKRSAIFEKDGQEVELKLPLPAGSLNKVGD